MIKNPNQTIHLDESDLVPPSQSCIICKGTIRLNAGSLQVSPKIELLRCSKCGVVSASRMPVESALAKFYEQYYQQDFYQARKERVAVIAPHRLANHIFKFATRYVRKKQLHILDFGGGDGSVAVLLAKHFIDHGYSQNIRITVVDYDVGSVMQSSLESIKISKQSSLDSSLTGNCDIVLASAVLEHLTDPRATLESLLNDLNPDGIFYARTPYIVPLRRLFSLW